MPKGALDDLVRRLHVRRLQADVGDVVDGDARRDLDPQRRHTPHWREAAPVTPMKAASCGCRLSRNA
jgi:hypothetical protein